MKYLLHRDESTYDASKKEFTFTCTENLKNPTRLVLEDVHYRASTLADHLYPQTIYVRSKAITEMLTKNHHVEIKADGSNRRSDVVAVLNQYETGRYELRRTHRFPVDKHRVNKVFDFQFSDNATALGDYTGGGTGYDAEFQITLNLV